MLKSILFFGSVVACASLKAQNSVQDGNFSNPATWDCNCVPSGAYALYITHDVILDIDYSTGNNPVQIYGGGSLIESGEHELQLDPMSSFSSTGNVVVSSIMTFGPTFISNESGGSLSVQKIVAINGDTPVINYGFFSADTAYLEGSHTNFGTSEFGFLEVANNYTNLGVLTADSIHSTAMNFLMMGTSNTIRVFVSDGGAFSHSPVTITEKLITTSNGGFMAQTGGPVIVEGDVINNGGLGIASSVLVEGDLISPGQIAGEGNLCVFGYSENTGTVSNINFCDATGSDFDLNTGAINSTVTFCTNGNCAELGLKEQTLNISVAPNPTDDFITVSAAIQIESLQIYAVTGELLLSAPGLNEVSVKHLAPGVYFIGINYSTQGIKRVVVN